MADRGKIILDGMTVPELEDLIQAAQTKIEETRTQARASMRAKMEEMAASAGLTLDEVVGLAPAKASGKGARKPGVKAVQAKYRGPNGDTWSGRGRPPKWLAVLEAEGKKREDYLI